MSNEGTMIDMFKIFIVEDDTGLVNLLKEYLHKFGYMTQSVHDFETVRDQFESYGPTLCFWISICQNTTAIIGAGSSAPLHLPDYLHLRP